MSLTLIAALTWPARVIGKDNAIPWRLGEDLKRFKELTLGHPVVMGRKTWESLPFKLPGRTNIVLSRRGPEDAAPSQDGRKPDAWADSLKRALELAANAPGGSEVFVMGGAQVYAEALPLAGRLALTLIHHPFGGDARFPAWDARDWSKSASRGGIHNGSPTFEYEFLDLQRTPNTQGAA